MRKYYYESEQDYNVTKTEVSRESIAKVLAYSKSLRVFEVSKGKKVSLILN